MPRKIKTYQTSQGFYDLAVATPSMKAALEAWGGKQNLFHQGFAKETDDSEVVAAAMAKPGVVLRRPVGTEQPFGEHADLPTIESLDIHPRKSKTPSSQRTPKTAKAARHAALAYERERSGGRRSARKKRRRRRKPARAVTRLCQRPRPRSKPQGVSTRQSRPRSKRIARR
jgi:colicin import membrane protein